MYLSRIELNTARRETMQALGSPGMIHGIVESCFAGERDRRLWRIDKLGEKTYLLLLSPEQPQLASIAKQLGYANDSGECAEYDKLLARIEADQRWRFRLRANPVYSKSLGSKEGRGRIYAHVTQAQQKEWLLSRAEKCGFSLSADAFDVVHTSWEKFKKRANERREVTIRTATFEGVLTVTNPEIFKKTLVVGIGKEKAYGCGLITVMRG
ncbi:MAG: type I-E CRISPR-associated protein Cas6/Cse3/CasE [Clostridia bacterium]|nr:type I-E CRISPR-associated protein Cas6/Cse3/CasE [Clostridia bacterium]